MKSRGGCSRLPRQLQWAFEIIRLLTKKLHVAANNERCIHIQVSYLGMYKYSFATRLNWHSNKQLYNTISYPVIKREGQSDHI